MNIWEWGLAEAMAIQKGIQEEAYEADERLEATGKTDVNWVGYEEALELQWDFEDASGVRNNYCPCGPTCDEWFLPSSAYDKWLYDDGGDHLKWLYS